MEVEGVSLFIADSVGEKGEERLGGGPRIAADEHGHRGFVDGEPLGDEVMLEGLDGELEILLIDEVLHLGLVVLLEHVAAEVGDLDSVVLALVVARRDDDAQVLVGLRLVEDGHEHADSEGDLHRAGST